MTMSYTHTLALQKPSGVWQPVGTRQRYQWLPLTGGARTQNPTKLVPFTPLRQTQLLTGTKHGRSKNIMATMAMEDPTIVHAGI